MWSVAYFYGCPDLDNLNSAFLSAKKAENFKRLTSLYCDERNQILSQIDIIGKDWLLQLREAFRPLGQILRMEIRSRLSQIQKIPRGREKALDALRGHISSSEFSYDDNDVYECLIYLSKEVDAALLRTIISRWKAEYREYIERESRLGVDEEFLNHMFWSVRRESWERDITVRYRFLSHFEVGDFPKIMNEVEEWAETGFEEHKPGPFKYLGEERTDDLVNFLWFITRDERLRHIYKGQIERALQRLAKGRVPPAWPSCFSVKENQNGPPITALPHFQIVMRTMAFSTLMLLQLGHNARVRELGVEAAKWLLQHQNADGSWRFKYEMTEGDVVTTIIALDALILSGLRGVEHSVELGRDWLLGKQNDFGGWEPERWYFPEVTVLVLELLEKIEKWKSGTAVQGISEPVAINVSTDHLLLDPSRYDEVLKTIFDAGKSIERKPSLYLGRDEESLRDQTLMFLESRFQGSATGETFNVSGKTDILIRHRHENWFIAECKFWGGQQKYKETLDQLLRYLTWRDRKTAALIFVRNQDIASVLKSVQTSMKQHPNFLRVLGSREGWYSAEFFANDDPQLPITLTTLVFHFPA
jgi:hypothetical protein